MYTGALDVMLYVRDLARSVAFYRDRLGFAVTGTRDAAEGAADPPFAVLSAGGARITLHETDREPGSGGAVLHLQVRDVDDFHERLNEAGVDHGEPRETPWGARMCLVRDPDGHFFGFYSPSA